MYIKYFLISFSICLGILIIPLGVIFTWYSGLVLSVFFSFNFSLFFTFFRQRNVKRAFFEITPHNKDNKISLMEYEKQIKEYLLLTRYRQTKNGVFENYSLMRTMGGDFKVESDPYSITVSGPYHLVKILAIHLETEGVHFKVTLE